VTESVAVVAPRLAQARRAAAGPLAARLPSSRLFPFSLAGYRRDATAPPRVVLWAAGDASASRAFLRRARERLLWPATASDFEDAIAGLRGGEPGESAVRRARRPVARARANRKGLPAALLLEGVLDARRARSALASGPPRDWILESVRLLRMSDRDLGNLMRRRIRLYALEPIILVAVAGPAALARKRGPWRRLVPPRAPIWAV
jgi:hypothetical protein